jgi:hypothetical protein
MPRVLKDILNILIILIVPAGFSFAQGPVFETRPVSFNSSIFSEIAPVLVKDGIIFCSDKRTSSLKGTTTFNDERLYNLYFVDVNDTTGKANLKPVKTTGNEFLDYGPICLAADGKTVYFTSSLLSGKAARKKGIKNPAGIFIGELSGTDIINVSPFEYNNPKYNLLHPSLSKDGKYLFFASDMPGGQGGTDLYYCEYVNSKWTTPVNLGSKVNSSSKELFPFMHSTGRLYYSSDRPTGTGGMDIYYTGLNFGNWDDPVQMPADINSTSDDFAFVAEESLQTGYFTSNRNRKNDDIFKFSSNIIRKVKCDSLQINNYCYEFLDSNAVKFDTIPFRYQWDFGDGTRAEGITIIHCFKGPGKYIVRLDVVNLVTKEIQKNEKTIPLDLTEIEQPYISGPAVCSVGKQIKLNADSTNLPGWNIKEYYWNYGDETVGTGMQVDKTFLKPGNFNIQLIVTSVPDATGQVREACVSKNINVIR